MQLRSLMFARNMGLILFVIAILSSTAALSANSETVTLAVDKMTCNMCPITVKKALKNVDGVTDVSAKYEGDGVGWAKVTFDPSKVNADELTRVTEQAGYPSRIAQ